ncbi:MAG: transporter, partial [Chitinivibrionales bacterium]
AVRGFNKDAYVCAELLDRKYEKYLKIYNCDEIYFSKEFSRYLLSRASSGRAISHIYSELMSEESGVTLTTCDVPENFIGKEYFQLKQKVMTEAGDTVVIGVIENTGNIRKRKNEALQHAQKNPDISSLVMNLQEVKYMVANKPVINPPDTYILNRHSMYIVINGSSCTQSREKA